MPAPVLDRYQRALARARDRIGAAAVTAWQNLGSYDEALVESFAARLAPGVAAAQLQIAALTDAYLAARLGRPVGGVDPEAVTGPKLRGLDSPAQEWRRPFATVWGALSQGVRWEDAAARGGHRVRQLVETDLQLSMRAAAHSVISADERVGGYRRVLTGAQSCGLCAVASAQRYHRGDLMPLHSGCDCTVEPIIGDNDPGRVANEDRLRQLRQSAAEGYSDRGALSHMTVDEHGNPTGAVKIVDSELGPTLVTEH